jgi:hypothetical protein
MSRRSQPPNEYTELAHALGFSDYPTDATAKPYLNYIANRYIGRSTREGYLKLVIHVVQYFNVGEEDELAPAKSIQGLLDRLTTSSNDHFLDTTAGSPTRHDDVEDTILYVVGVWTMLLSSFVHLPVAGGARKIALAYSIRAQDNASLSGSHPYEGNIADLISGSGLLPDSSQWGLSENIDDDNMVRKAAIQRVAMLSKSQTSSIRSLPSPSGSVHSLQKLNSLGRALTPMSLRFLDDLDSLESLHVAATRLNAYTLSVFGAVDIAWTHNISRHMLLCKRSGRHVLEVFALPCALSASILTSKAVGITPGYAQEVRESYSILFSAWSEIPRHAKLGRYLGAQRLCWCWSCSAHRHRTQMTAQYRKIGEKRTLGAKRNSSSYASEFDPLLIEIMHNEPSDWTPELFPSLWSRIMLLEEHLQTAKPWNVWILFRDRRDTLQFWTFL